MNNDPFKRPLDDWEEWAHGKPSLTIVGYGPLIFIAVVCLAGIIELLCGCASLPQAHSDYAAIHALPVQKGDVGFYFAAEDRDYMVKEGVPISLFASTPRGWYLTRLQEIEAANDIHDAENHVPAWTAQTK